MVLVHALGSAPSLWRFYPGLILVFVGLCTAKNTLRKWILFFLLSGCVAWFQSAVTLHGGNVIHHAVLLWINWYAALSLSLTVFVRSRVRYGRPVMALIVGLFCLRGLLVIGADYGALIAHLGISRWTDADTKLVDQLGSARIRRIIVADWGIKNVVLVRSNNRIAVNNQGVSLNLGMFNLDAFSACLPKECVVVTRTPGKNVFPNAPATLDQGFSKSGLHAAEKTVVYDTHGVSAFEFFHVYPSSSVNPK